MYQNYCDTYKTKKAYIESFGSKMERGVSRGKRGSNCMIWKLVSLTYNSFIKACVLVGMYISAVYAKRIQTPHG